MSSMKNFGALVLIAMGISVSPAFAEAAPKVIKVDASVNTTNCPQYLAFM